MWIGSKTIYILKELRNYNRKLFLCLPKKYGKTQPALWTAIFHNKFTFWHIRLNTYIKKNAFTSYKQYLFGLLFPQKSKMTRTDQSTLYFFTLPEKKRLTNLWKKQLQKRFSSVCMLLVKLASIFFFHVITGRHSFL